MLSIAGSRGCKLCIARALKVASYPAHDHKRCIGLATAGNRLAGRLLVGG